MASKLKLKKKFRQLNKVQKGKILAWKNLKKPLSNRGIGRCLEKSENTVRYFLKNYAFNGTDRKKGSGRPATTKRTDCRILRKIKKNPHLSSGEIKKELELKISERTISRKLKNFGYSSYYVAKKPYISEKNRL